MRAAGQALSCHGGQAENDLLDALLAGLEATAVAQTLRTSRWLYAATNTAHIFGIALLVGAIVPLDLRLLGWWPDVPRASRMRSTRVS